MTYLVDTNACIALINGTPRQVRRRFQRIVARDATILLSSVVAFELWCGAAKSQRRVASTQRLQAFLAGPLEWTDFDDEDAREAGTVRAELEAAGKPIGAYNMLIAAQARRRQATLVTSNVTEFARVPHLKWEDWAGARRKPGSTLRSPATQTRSDGWRVRAGATASGCCRARTLWRGGAACARRM